MNLNDFITDDLDFQSSSDKEEKTPTSPVTTPADATKNMEEDKSSGKFCCVQ